MNLAHVTVILFVIQPLGCAAACWYSLIRIRMPASVSFGEILVICGARSYDQWLSLIIRNNGLSFVELHITQPESVRSVCFC
jgi:hypothetical protein